jgi:uncharacterized protein
MHRLIIVIILILVRFQNEELLRKYIDHGVDINDLNPESGTSPLMLAAALGYTPICKLLIDAGADVNASDFEGNRPLHLAAQGYGEQITVLKLLLDHGSDPRAVNENGFTPAILSKGMDNEACFNLLSMSEQQSDEPPVYQ